MKRIKIPSNERGKYICFYCIAISLNSFIWAKHVKIKEHIFANRVLMFFFAVRRIRQTDKSLIKMCLE